MWNVECGIISFVGNLIQIGNFRQNEVIDLFLRLKNISTGR